VTIPCSVDVTDTIHQVSDPVHFGGNRGNIVVGVAHDDVSTQRAKGSVIAPATQREAAEDKLK
jgi:hypothetical protein